MIVRDLSASITGDMVRRGIPAEAAAHIKFIAEIYKSERESGERLRPSEARAQIEALEQLVGQLSDRLYKLPVGVDDAVFNAAHLTGRREIIHELRKQLAEFSAVLNFAWQRVEPRDGRPGSWRASMAANIAGILEGYGVAATAKPNGPLCQALGILFAAMGEKGRGGRDEPNPREIAKTALELRKNHAARA